MEVGIVSTNLATIVCLLSETCLYFFVQAGKTLRYKHANFNSSSSLELSTYLYEYCLACPMKIHI